MQISRRSLIGGMAATGVALGLSGCDETKNNSSTAINKKTSDANSFPKNLALPEDPDGLLLNHINAVEEMQKADIDLLLCSDPINVQYLTNIQSTASFIGIDGVNYASLSSSIDNKPTFIGSRIGYYFDAPKQSVGDQLDFRFSGLPAEPEIFGTLTEIQDIINAPAIPFGMPREHDLKLLSSNEKRRLRQVKQATTELRASLEACLLEEITQADLPNKTIAIDDPNLRMVIEKSGLNLKIVDGERLVRRMRMIKSTKELEYMRFAAQANALSAKMAAKSARDGATFREIRNEFAKACATLDMKAKFLMLDTHNAWLADGDVRDGRSFLMDAVSTFQEYHGDYGRSVCLGEPNRKMQQVIDGLSWVWDRIFPELKPGITYGEIYGLANKLFAETGVDVRYGVNPHNVGMHHHDEPNARDFSLTFEKDLNIELKENMVVSIDMPVLDAGQGGSAHLEDCVLITADGGEFINDPNDRLIMV